MKKLILVLVITLGFLLPSYAQVEALSGNITDTVEKKGVYRAVIAILDPYNSSLLAFTRSTEDGSFTVNKIPAGPFCILVSHPGYADYTDTIKPDGTALSIPLTPRMKLLQEVIVRQKMPAIRMRGDTTEYMADSFKLKPNATVEDLLRVLPGLLVNRKGEISATGKKVQKILVDGEEFFSEDPTVATQNLKADIVDKVQLFDKKSNTAGLTGMDDGQAIKALNLKLKEQKNAGYFGKVEASSDASRYYDNNAMINSFRGKRKLSLFGLLSNNGKTGLNMRDNAQYGGGERPIIDAVEEENAGNYLPLTVVANGAAGVPRSHSAGVHYSNKWLNDAYHLNSNYRYNAVYVEPNSTAITQETLPGAVYVRKQEDRSAQEKNAHHLSMMYTMKTDSLAALQLSVSGLKTVAHTRTVGSTTGLQNERLVNSIERTANAEEQNDRIQAGLTWEKKFRRKGRSFSVQSVLKSNRSRMDAWLFTASRLYRGNGNGHHTDTMDQRKDIHTAYTYLQANINFSEPLSKNILVGINYGASVNQRQSNYYTYVPVQGKYTDRIDSVTNEYTFDITAHTAGLNLQWLQRKMQYNLGSDFSWYNCRQRNLFKPASYEDTYGRILPRATISYTINSYKQISFVYGTHLQFPTLLQVQPLLNNADPLNVLLGNPLLQPSYKHSFALSMNDVKPIHNRFLNAGITYRLAKNDFSSGTYIDSLGQRVSQTININGNRDGSAFVYYTRQAGKLGLSMYGSAGYASFNNRVNNRMNRNTNLFSSIQPGISWQPNTKWALRAQSTFSYNHAKSDIFKELVTKYWTQEHIAEATLPLPWQLEFNTDCSFNIRQRIQASDRNTNVVQWNAQLTKRVLKNALTCTLLVKDILDQNKGFSRWVSGNQIIENVSNVLQRYWMVSVTWNFTKTIQPNTVTAKTD